MRYWTLSCLAFLALGLLVNAEFEMELDDDVLETMAWWYLLYGGANQCTEFGQPCSQNVPCCQYSNRYGPMKCYAQGGCLQEMCGYPGQQCNPSIGYHCCLHLSLQCLSNNLGQWTCQGQQPAVG